MTLVNKEILAMVLIYLSGYSQLHGEVVLNLFKKYGNADDFQFLEQKAQTADPKLAKEIRKFIEKRKTKKS